MKACELEKRLKEVLIENGEITSIDFLPEETPPLFNGIQLSKAPERCRVCVKLYPSAESDIGFELWLPLAKWNGKFLGTGNGGSAGSIVTNFLYAGVARGYATANTDMGSATNADELIGKPERWVDFGHRATHLMTVVSKQLMKAFYGREAESSYFLGGSTGGQQALMEAQRYPDDYDGIIAFCPAYNRVNLHQEFVWFLQITCDNPEAIFTPEQISKVSSRILEKFVKKCGGAPGDNFLSYPGKAGFTPDDVEETFGNLGLNSAQTEVLKKMYTFPKIPGTNEEMYSTLPLGCENAILYLPYIKEGFNSLLGFLQRWAFGSDFDYKTFDYQQDYLKMVALFRKDLDATSPDLTRFKAHGGKLIMVSGSTDCLIPYSDTKKYYESVVKYQGGLDHTMDFFRFFHVPGLGHGSGGTGFQEIGSMGGIPSVPLDKEHDVLCALEAWVEKDKAPELLLPVAFIDGDMTKEMSHDRPVYPYPDETEYVSGDPKKRESFRRKKGNGNY